MFSATFTIFVAFKNCGFCNFPNVMRNVWHNAGVLYGYVVTFSRICEFTRQLFWTLKIQTAWKINHILFYKTLKFSLSHNTLVYLLNVFSLSLTL